jgi:Ca-activated chloride channel family protein
MGDTSTNDQQPRIDDDGGVASLTAETDRDLIREGARSVRYVRIVLDAAKAPAGTTRSPLTLALAVDRSGSMNGPRLALAKQAVATVLRMLSPTDAFSLIWFDDEITASVAPTRPATPAAVAEAIRAAQAVAAGGTTALHAGWLAAASTVERAAPGAPPQITRCLLITDGQANVGLQSPTELAAETRRMLAQRGVVTSCLGIGEGYNDELLRAMADACDGQAYHVDDASGLPAVLAREVGDALTIVGRAVELQVRPTDGVRVEVLGHFSNRWTGRHLAISLGDLATSQQLELVLRVTMPSGPTLLDPSPSVEITAWSAGEPCVVAPARAQWQFADNARCDQQPRRTDVDQTVATAYAALAREQAGDLARHDNAAAAEVLRKASRRIKSYAGTDPVLNALAEALELEAMQIARGIDEGSRKRYTMDAYSTSKGRTGDGSVRRRQ